MRTRSRINNLPKLSPLGQSGNSREIKYLQWKWEPCYGNCFDVAVIIVCAVNYVNVM